MSRQTLVQQMTEERAYTAKQFVAGAPLVREVDSKRMLEHVIADIAHGLMATPNTDPVGLTITVTCERLDDESQYYLVTGSLPQDISGDERQ